MEALDLEPQVSPNRRGITFVLSPKTGPVECMVPRVVLESFFWLPSHADDVKMLKIFRDGADRIHAVAHRKLLAHPVARLELSAADFSRD